MRCSRCAGSGQYMGSGMIIMDCYCEEFDEIPVKPKQPVQIDKRSKSYREAIEKIMNTYDVNRAEAVRVFESEFDKIA